MRRLIALVTGGVVMATLSAAFARLYATRVRGFRTPASASAPDPEAYIAPSDAPIQDPIGLPTVVPLPVTVGPTEAAPRESPPQPRHFRSPRQRLWRDSSLVLVLGSLTILTALAFVSTRSWVYTPFAQAGDSPGTPTRGIARATGQPIPEKAVGTAVPRTNPTTSVRGERPVTAPPSPRRTRSSPPPSPSPSHVGPCSGTPGCFTYTVRAGDTLFTIAKRFGVPPGKILTLNPKIRKPSDIRPGVALTIPR